MAKSHKKATDERCAICGCRLHRGAGAYAKPTPEGRAHASEHHFVAERFFGRSTNRRGELRDRIFEECPWGSEGKSATYCYECHEVLLHNPVLLPGDVRRFRDLVEAHGFAEREKPADHTKLAGRIRLLHEIIDAGLTELTRKS